MRILSEVVNYAYPNARIRGMQSVLLDAKTIKALTDAKDLAGFSTILEATHYRKDMHKLEIVNAMNIEIVLLENLVDINTKITLMAPEMTRSFFDGRSKKYEIMTLKGIINSKIDQTISPERIKSRSFMLSKRVKIILPRLIEMRDFDEIAELFRRTEYGMILKDMLPAYRELGTVLPFMVVLDKHYFTSLWEKISLLEIPDRKVAEKFVGIEIDTINIMTIFRAKTQEYDPEKFLVPIRYDIDIQKCVEAETVSDVIGALSRTIYASILNESVPVYEKTGSLLPFELNLKRFLVKKIATGLTGYPFQIGALLGYLKLKDREIENLRAIAVGVEDGLPSDEIRALLI